MTLLMIVFIIAAFGAVAALVGAAGSMFAPDGGTELESRLDILTGAGGEEEAASDSSLLSSFDDGWTIADQIISRFGNVTKLIEQAGMKITSQQLLLCTAGAGGAGIFVPLFLGWPFFLAPILGLMGAALPFMYLLFRRKKRMSAFARQLPEALELISRALRAGHSLAAGFSLVGEELRDPIGSEFMRCYEEQNLGIPLDEAIEEMTERVPNLDLRFFATAVVLQRQTGGDLAEILDKIGQLVRERFRIWGQIQALTGEGRLSGIVLLALPPCLFLALYRLNPDYCMILFDDPMGQQMLAVAGIMQIVGALVIKKIITIKV